MAVRSEGERPLVATAHSEIRLRVPGPSPGHVDRSRLVDQLRAAGPDGITLVHGPAGSGKTGLVASWVAGIESPVAWLTLNERDLVASELLADLAGAVGRLRPACLDQLAALVRADPAPDLMAAELLLALEGSDGRSAVLVVDDLHVVGRDPALMAVFRDLVRHLPDRLHLVLVSRALPPLPLDRARLDHKVTTIDFDDLRFSDDEAAELLARLVPDAEESWIDATVERVGGWVAGLQLFALASGAESGMGSTALEMTSDYLFAEALHDQPAEIVELLKGIAVVGRVNVPLARRLTGREDAGVALRQAFEQDLFVSRRDHGWYELQGLVREVLMALLDDDLDQARAFHSRAARYFEADQDFESALDHWGRAGRHREVLRLLSEVHLSLYDAGRHDVVRRTIAAIPADAYATDHAALMQFTWCQVLIDRTRFLDGLARLTWRQQRGPMDGVLGARLMLLKSVAATMRGDWVGGGQLARDAMTELGPDWILDPMGRFGLNMVARDVALSERWHDDDDDVRRADLELAHDPARRVSFEGIRAIGEAMSGHPLDALQTASGVRRIADVSGMPVLGEELALAESIARREIGDLEGVVETLEVLARSEVAPVTYVRVVALAELVALHLGRGATHAARSEFEQLARLAENSAAGPAARSLVARCGVDLALAEGAIDDAARWVSEIDDPFWRPVDEARTHLARQAREEALTCLSDAVPRCTRHDVVLVLHQAAATSPREEALKCAASAVELAVANGLVQTVAAQGAEVGELVERCAWRVPTSWLARVRVAAAGGGAPGLDGDGPVEPIAGAGSLTARERDVLRLLPSRLSLREIASELYISINTLKFHLKIIYRKLDVSSRADAAEIARQVTSLRIG